MNERFRRAQSHGPPPRRRFRESSPPEASRARTREPSPGSAEAHPRESSPGPARGRSREPSPDRRRGSFRQSSPGRPAGGRFREPSRAPPGGRSKSRGPENRNYQNKSFRTAAEWAAWNAIPESDNAIFIRGLPNNLEAEQIEDYLKEKIGGPLETIFFKPSRVQNEKRVIAIRFQDPLNAQLSVRSLDRTRMYGNVISVEYFKDIPGYHKLKGKQFNRDDNRRGRDGSRERSPLSKRCRTVSPERYAASRRAPETRNRYGAHAVIDVDNTPTPPMVQNKRPGLLPTPPSMHQQKAMLHYNTPESVRQQRVNPLGPFPPSTVLHPPGSPGPSSSKPKVNVPPGFFTATPRVKVEQEEEGLREFGLPSTFGNPQLRHNDTNRFNFMKIRDVSRRQPEAEPEGPSLSQGRISLGKVSSQRSKDAMRSKKMAILDEASMKKVAAMYEAINKDFNEECDTYGFVVQQLISKDLSLMQSLRVCLNKVLADLNAEYMKKFDRLLESFSNS